MRITVLGGTGYAGSHVVAEAVKRGHEVVSFSRNAPDTPVDGATYRTGSVLDEHVLVQAVQDADAVFETLSPRGDLAGKLEGVVDRLIELAARANVRLGVLGGASSLHTSPGGPRLIEVQPPKPEIAGEINTGIALLEALKAAPEQLDWFYVSPAAGFGAWVPGEATGRYRVSDDVLLVDENGDSMISGADLAMAVVDEFERPAHRRTRFHVAY